MLSLKCEPGFKLVKQNRLAKNLTVVEVFGFANYLIKMGRVLTKFYELIWNNMYYESLWNHVGIQQGIFNRLKIIYYKASSMKL